MTDYEVIDANAENISSCGFCGYRDPNNLGHRRKTDWLRDCYAEGLRLNVLRSRRFGDIGMIAYALGNHAWRPSCQRNEILEHYEQDCRTNGRTVSRSDSTTVRQSD